MKKRRHHFSDEDIHYCLFVETEAVECYVSGNPNKLVGTIFYCSKDGRSWIMMIEDMLLHLACLEYLKKHGAPFFSETSDLLNHQKKLEIKYKRKNT